jgi:hypothetical protein
MYAACHETFFFFFPMEHAKADSVRPAHTMSVTNTPAQEGTHARTHTPSAESCRLFPTDLDPNDDPKIQNLLANPNPVASSEHTRTPSRTSARTRPRASLARPAGRPAAAARIGFSDSRTLPTASLCLLLLAMGAHCHWSPSNIASIFRHVCIDLYHALTI